ncbi:unnamed protein product, partial [Haemonchus placei]|uniref:Ovule protein n=1 Tax=Haemonchus placei TaxID=6290 RepID=A0A0N4W5N7_HAEPC
NFIPFFLTNLEIVLKQEKTYRHRKLIISSCPDAMHVLMALFHSLSFTISHSLLVGLRRRILNLIIALQCVAGLRRGI